MIHAVQHLPTLAQLATDADLAAALRVQHGFYLVMLFALGSCVGSFLNVVVWRLPRITVPLGTPSWKVPYLLLRGLSDPPSHCPKCQKRLKWYDNIPILGWIKLGGRCRFCQQKFSIRYPIVELVTAVLFAGYYALYYLADVGPCPPVPRLFFGAEGLAVYTPPPAPLFLLHLFVLSCLLAASLIDAERYEIPQPITWLLAGVAILTHAMFDAPRSSGALSLVRPDGSPSGTAALAAGGAVGLVISLLLLWRGWLPRAFPDGEPLLEVDREAIEADNAKLVRAGKEPEVVPPPLSRRLIAAEMRKEMAFLLPPMVLAIAWWVVTTKVPTVGHAWADFARRDWASGLLGALFGAMIGGAVVWLTRILGSLGFGRVAMGLGDVDLMFAVGAALGAGAATVAFFLAPFCGMIVALYLIFTGKRREVPYGPYLGLASAAVMLCYCPIERWLEPGMAGLGLIVQQVFGRG